MNIENIRKTQQRGDLKTAREAIEQLLHDKQTELPALKALYGVVLFQANETDRGRKLILKAAATEPDYSHWASDLGFGLFLIGNVDKARHFLEKAVYLPGSDATAFNRLGAIYHLQKNSEGAAKAFQEALLRDPDRADIHHNLGVVMTEIGQLEEALVHFDRALAINPKMTHTDTNRARLMVAMEKSEEAIIEMEVRLEKEPDSVCIRRQLSRILEASGRYDEAFSELEAASGFEPENIDLMLQTADLFFKRERYAAALKVLEKAIKIEPESLTVQNLLARVLSETKRYDCALEIIEKALKKHPDSPSCLLTRATIYANADNFFKAEDDLSRVIEVLPGAAEAWGLLGQILIFTGRMKEAVSALERAAELNPAALAGLIQARSFPDDPEVIERMSDLTVNPIMPRDSRIAMGFALAGLFESRNNFDQAFFWVDKANALVRKSKAFNFTKWQQHVNQIREIFIPDLFQKLKGQGSSSERPVFIVGLPRSGTTLTEQILASHPDVFGAGELGYIKSITQLMPGVIKTDNRYPYCMHLFQKWLAGHAASYYLKKIEKMNSDAARVVDKMPHNYLHLGLIAIIFPNARIIHVKRDFRDVAVSHYFTNFKHKYTGMSYAFDLIAIGHTVREYLRLMKHWRTVLPFPIFELQYEDLVENTEKKARELLGFVGLEWDERVMEFYRTQRPVKTASAWQVRQPVYQSSKHRWKNYEKHLGPFLEVMEGLIK